MKLWWWSNLYSSTPSIYYYQSMLVLQFWWINILSLNPTHLDCTCKCIVNFLCFLAHVSLGGGWWWCWWAQWDELQSLLLGIYYLQWEGGGLFLCWYDPLMFTWHGAPHCHCSMHSIEVLWSAQKLVQYEAGGNHTWDAYYLICLSSVESCSFLMPYHHCSHTHITYTGTG